MIATFAVVLSLAACTDEPAPAPSGPSPSDGASSPSVSASPSASDSPSAAPSPSPSEVPSRAVQTGGTLKLTFGEVTGNYADILCETSSGLDVVASAGALEGVQFTVDSSNKVQSLAITLPDGVTALVGKNVGDATFTGDNKHFAVHGNAVAAVDGKATPMPFTVDGGC
ncbi:MAG: lipoprotein LpqH [Propionibacteriaceae bacterium]|nr:lipoprotein LpqH [Propionibacteriaceae bacterium]